MALGSLEWPLSHPPDHPLDPVEAPKFRRSHLLQKKKAGLLVKPPAEETPPSSCLVDAEPDSVDAEAPGIEPGVCSIASAL